MLDTITTLAAAAFAFPTVIFTVLLGLVALYWLVSLVTGGADVDGALEGVLDGAAEGAAEGLLDGAVDGIVDGAADAVADGAADAIADGALDAAAAVPGAGQGLAAKAVGCLGLTVVPATIVGSLAVLFSWLSSLALTRLLGHHVGVGTTGLVVGTVIAAGAVVLGLVVTSWAVRPLRYLFTAGPSFKRRDLVGKSGVVTTLKVTAGFGMAEVDDGAAGLRLEVRCAEPNPLTRGARVRIVEYREADEVFVVVPDGPAGTGHQSWVLEGTPPPLD